MVMTQAEKNQLWEKVTKLVAETYPGLPTVDTMCAIVHVYECVLRVLEGKQ